MVTLHVRDWGGLYGLDHTATSYKIGVTKTMISGKEEVTDIIDSITQSTEYKNVWYSDVVVPAGEVYYASFMRHLSDGSYTQWSQPIELLPSIQNSLMYTYKDTVINKPIIKTNNTQYTDPGVTNLIIETGPFISNNDTHHHTHWVMTDQNGDVIYSNLYNETDLTSITIPKASINRYTTLNVLYLTVIFGTYVGVHSKPTTVQIHLANTNYQFTNDLSHVVPYTTLTLGIDLIDELLPHGIIRLEVLDSKNNNIYKTDVTEEATEISIPSVILYPNSNYVIVVYSTDSSGEITTRRYILTTIQTKQYIPYDPFTIYPDEPTEIRTVASDYPKNVITSEWYNGVILLPEAGSSSLKYYTYDSINDNLVLVGNYNGIVIDSSHTDEVWIELLENNTLLVDHINVDGYPTLGVYQHDPITNTALFITNIIRTNETKSFGYNNSVYIKDLDTLIYFPYGTNVLRKLTISTGTIVDLTTIPDDHTGGCMINMTNDRLLVYGGPTSKDQIYRIADNVWTEGENADASWLDQDLRGYSFPNGSGIITRQVTDVTYDESYIYYNKLTGDITEKQMDLTNDMPIDVYIRLKNKDVVGINHNIGRTQYGYFHYTAVQ